MRIIRILIWLSALALLAAGCGDSRIVYVDQQSLSAKTRTVAVAPLVNLSTYPRAGLIAGQIAGVQLRMVQGFKVISMDEVLAESRLSEFELEEQKDAGPHIEAAKKLGADSVLKGSVTEYRYVPGVYDRPSVGLILELMDLKSGKVVWSAAIARSGNKFRTDDLTLSQLTSELCSEVLAGLAD